VDTWLGDGQAGFYGSDVYDEFRSFHDQRFKAFSSLLRMTFDEACQQIGDKTVDLLHIDGLHSYDAVRHDFDLWLPKLSERATVLFHDTNVREADYGVWRLWDEIAARFPAFEFIHGHGLGVLGVGRNLPLTIRALCMLNQHPDAAKLRQRFEMLGERWHVETLLDMQRISYSSLQASVGNLLAQAGARNNADWQAATAERRRLEAEQATLIRDLQQVRGEVEALRDERSALLNSTVWRATKPLRLFGSIIPTGVRKFRPTAALARWGRQQSLQDDTKGANGVEARTQDYADAALKPGWSIVFISGEPDTPGHIYRILHHAEAAVAVGAEVQQIEPMQIRQHRDALEKAKLVVLWRVAMSADVGYAITTARASGAIILFDIDDLMVKPEIAQTDLIDGIRSQRLSPEDVQGHYRRVRDVLGQSDACIASTEPLAWYLREADKDTFVIPNGFDSVTHRKSRIAVRERQRRQEDGLVRLGYASGTFTHQRDFAVAA
jgi:hypothetical protein